MTQSIIAAESAYFQAVASLSAACALLLRHIPSVISEDVSGSPSLWPSAKESCGPTNVQCKAEISDQRPGCGSGQVHVNHVVTSLAQCVSKQGVDTFIEPSTEVIQEDICRLVEKFELFTSAASATICLK